VASLSFVIKEYKIKSSWGGVESRRMAVAIKIQEPDPLFFNRFKIGFFLAS